jgi:hypothetical protein
MTLTVSPVQRSVISEKFQTCWEADLSQKVTIGEHGEVLQLVVTINEMVDRLATFAAFGKAASVRDLLPGSLDVVDLGRHAQVTLRADLVRDTRVDILR